MKVYYVRTVVNFDAETPVANAAQGLLAFALGVGVIEFNLNPHAVMIVLAGEDCDAVQLRSKRLRAMAQLFNCSRAESVQIVHEETNAKPG